MSELRTLLAVVTVSNTSNLLLFVLSGSVLTDCVWSQPEQFKKPRPEVVYDVVYNDDMDGNIDMLGRCMRVRYVYSKRVVVVRHY